MRQRIQQLGPFWRNVATVLGGAAGAQALPLLAAPLLTRMCSPGELGAYSVWLGLVAISAIGATLRMEAAMILDHEPERQRACFRVVFYTTSVAALALTVLAAGARLAGFELAAKLPWTALLTIGIATWLTGCMQTTLAFATSHNAFGKAARAKVATAAIIVASQLALLYAGLGGIGLVLGHLAGTAAGFATARMLLHPPAAPIGWRLDTEQRGHLLRHQKFWRYSLPSNLLNGAVSQLPLFLIGMRHGALAAGLYALTQRVLSAPISLLAASVLEVFKRESVREFQEHGNCERTYRHTFKALAALGAGPALVLLLFAPDLFALVFGERWRASGHLAQLMAPLFLLNFVASPLSYVFFVAGRQKADLLWQVSLFALTVGAFLAPGSIEQNVLWYAIGYSFLYLVYLHMSWQCSRNVLAAA
ncbi:oligosaccharide flippase family protein [Massilia yuzhufengensis]|uniref:Membrane protein involved in the export of O-antigen and teichoic acid n=1 Tax=Massilia yuzhufengensis TaxID=1164594 RepID=A0A1I1EDU7_9BURK|nr:oligosaccharide flippase family protein [Massilia yuzhufengensis]SFB85334.1 Membrane protein involved in the export of O-antigen and teichoic acid [Massilia yuzhufengensis]